MQRPHRSLRVRLQRSVAVVGGQLPPSARRVVRRVADRVEPLIVGGPEAAAVKASQAEIVTSFDAWQTVADLAAALTEALIAEGVDVARLERNGIVTLAVPREKRDAALAAIRTSPKAAGWWGLGRGMTWSSAWIGWAVSPGPMAMEESDDTSRPRSSTP